MTLENKLGITDDHELALIEEKISKEKALKLFEEELIDSLEPGTYESLKFIHKYLFEDIYDFAGELRTVDISKDGFRFASVLYLEAALKEISKMPQSNFDEIIDKYIEMNVAHPFREGNGRSTRIWLDNILKKELGYVVDWSRIEKQDYLLAMQRSPIKDLEIKVLLKQALTDKINDREVYMKGIDASYLYEGYTTYKTADLLQQYNKTSDLHTIDPSKKQYHQNDYENVHKDPSPQDNIRLDDIISHARNTTREFGHSDRSRHLER